VEPQLQITQRLALLTPAAVVVVVVETKGSQVGLAVQE
jgi:hypothetical protein